MHRKHNHNVHVHATRLINHRTCFVFDGKRNMNEISLITQNGKKSKF